MTSIARSYPERVESARPTRRVVLERVATFSVATFVLGAFAPYPALAIGNSNGLQISQALTLAAIPVLLLRMPSRSFLALVVVLVPIYLSAFLNALRPGTREPEVLFKELISTSLALLVLWPSCWLATRERFRLALVLAAAAITAHALLGFYQVYAFSHDEFPLLWLYQNPSFKGMDTWADLYAKYMKRPCGLFPEPSAMASALGPWVVILAGWLFGAAPGIPLRGTAWWLTAVAVLAGLTLLLLSRTGSIGAIILGSLVATAVQPPKQGSRRWIATMVLAVVAASAAGVVATMQLGSGLEQRIESSWGMRSQSIIAALTANTEPFNVIFGDGAGQSTPIIRELMNGVPRPKDQDDMAVFSLAATYYMENGLIGAAALLAVLSAALLAILRSSARALGLGAMIAWLVGVTVTTSYMALPPVWMFLGAALSWDRIFPCTARARSESA